MKFDKGIAFATGAGATLAVAITFILSSYGLIPADRTISDNAIHDYLLSHPEVLVDMTNRLQARQQETDDAARQVAVNKLGAKAFFDPAIAFVTGPTNAKTTIVEFFDYNCPYCRASVSAVEKFYDAHRSDVRFAFIEFPINGQNSIVASRFALAARMQPDKYLAFHFALMREEGEADATTILATAKKVGLDLAKLQVDEKSPAIDSALAASHDLARAALIDGTPAFIIDGKIREGRIDDNVIKEMARK